jgi:hypothetical protein
MCRVVKDFMYFSLFNNLPGIKDSYPLAGFCNYA